MRAELDAREDKPLPGLSSGAPSVEVAADFTGIYRILMGASPIEAENREFGRYQSTSRTARPAPVWQENSSDFEARRVSYAALHSSRYGSSIHGWRLAGTCPHAG